MKIVVVTGGFDPLHSGHIAYFESAKQLGDRLIVGLNSDDWLERKKGRAFMPFIERQAIIRGLGVVDSVIDFDDDDDTARDAIEQVRLLYAGAEIVFANGGDRTHVNIPEMTVNDKNVSFAFGVGGFNKTNSSSWILQEWQAPKTERAWGYYRILHQVPGTKVKELTVNPGASLSMQRHEHRHEFWHVTEGACEVDQKSQSGYNLSTMTLNRHSQLIVLQGSWHRIRNPFDTPCKIVEIQYGTACEESDIERDK